LYAARGRLLLRLAAVAAAGIKAVTLDRDHPGLQRLTNKTCQAAKLRSAARATNQFFWMKLMSPPDSNTAHATLSREAIGWPRIFSASSSSLIHSPWFWQLVPASS